jgi:hypothetical protein
MWAEMKHTGDRKSIMTIPRPAAVSQTPVSKLLVSVAAMLATALGAHAEPIRFDRDFAEALGVLAPSERVEGSPGDMRITQRSCRTLPRAGIRRRIVDIAVQEWGFFGFQVLDETKIVDSERRHRRTRRRTPWLSPEESARVAATIAGYWSITADGGWILSRQNAVWKEGGGVAARWRDPWSAAFISWVMCEGGLGNANQFQRAIAHHAYIDQAIEARQTDATQAAFLAFDVGEMPVEPGDLLCFSRRPVYRSIAERRRDLGTGIRSHCDLVVKVDVANERILGIGGNVRGAVRLKLLPAVFEESPGTQPVVRSVGRSRLAVFAHLKLRADSIEVDAFENSITMRLLIEQDDAFGSLIKQLQGERSISSNTVSTSSQPAKPPASAPQHLP